MLTAFMIAALVLAGVSLAFAIVAGGHGRLAARRRSAAPGTAEASHAGAVVAALAAAALFWLGGATLAALDRFVAPHEPASAAPPPATAPSARHDYLAVGLPSFSGGLAVWHSRRLDRPMCLVRYYDRSEAQKNGGDPRATWWTTCAYATHLDSIAEVRRRLALLVDWGARDARVVAKIPAGTRVTYLTGLAAGQCEPAGMRCYPGGGVQLRFRDASFDRAWFTRRECTHTPETALVRFRRCPG